MVQPRFKSMKKTQRKTPSGRTTTIYKSKKPARSHCAICAKRLHGVPTELRKKALTEKRPERLFGGVLCGSCVQQLMKEKTRLHTKKLDKKDVQITHYGYLKQLGVA